MNNGSSLDDIVQSVSELLSEAILDTMQIEQISLISQQSKKQQILFEQVANLRRLAERVKHGIEVIVPVVVSLGKFEPDLIKPGIVEQVKSLEKDKIELQKWVLATVVENDQKPSFDISSEVKFALYRAGVEIYNQRLYEDAAAAFALLTLLDPSHYDGWIALGSAEYFCERFTPALIAYAMAAYADPTRPECHFHAAHCYEALKQYDYALNSLDLALLVMAGKVDFREKVAKAEEHKRHLNDLAHHQKGEF